MQLCFDALDSLFPFIFKCVYVFRHTERERKPDGSNDGWVKWEQTFRTTWMKSLGLCGLRPCSWRVHASKEDAWATISTLFPTGGGGPGRMEQTTKFSCTGSTKSSRCFCRGVSHQCFCSLTGCLWSPGSSGSCSSRTVRTR